MGKSIIEKDSKFTCWMCGSFGHTELHHCFHGTSRRKKADEDGMVLHLCRECHRKVHECPESGYDDYIKSYAEEYWCRYYKKTTYDFIQRYGKSYRWRTNEDN